jgi:hypothetical protein
MSVVSIRDTNQRIRSFCFTPCQQDVKQEYFLIAARHSSVPPASYELPKKKTSLLRAPFQACLCRLQTANNILMFIISSQLDVCHFLQLLVLSALCEIICYEKQDTKVYIRL